MLKDKNVLVMGMGITGISCVSALNRAGARVFAHDDNKDLKKIEGDFKIFLNDLNEIDLIVKSPGIPPSDALLTMAEKLGIEIITDIELFFRLTGFRNIIAITGTNGKTTTTSMIAGILKRVATTYVVGNIGNPILDIIPNLKEEDFVVVETSSFQLANITKFKPRVSVITYIGSDHLDWHTDLEDYQNSKLNILKNQDADDFAILYLDDPLLKDINLESKKLYFSDTQIADAYVSEGSIKLSKGDHKLIDLKDLRIIGTHNYRNVMASALAAIAIGVDLDTIREALFDFTGVAHRIEFVREIDKVKFYNDSKGTNPDSTTVALKAMDGPTILIAGGYDKKSDYSKIFKNSASIIKALVLMGETAPKIAECAKEYGVKTYIVKDMQSAVALSKKLSEEGDNILLSPACASWDMYKSYIERGEHFKTVLGNLK